MTKFYSSCVAVFRMEISSILSFGLICLLATCISALVLFSYSDPSSLILGIQTVNADINIPPVDVPTEEEPLVPSKVIVVSLKDQTLVYMEDTEIVGQFKISSGLPYTPTPPGEYTVLKKKPFVNYRGPGYNFPNTKWNLMFKTGNPLNYYIHGAYWHKNFGHPMSHGCINVAYADMEKLYKWADEGTRIIIQPESLDLNQNYNQSVYPNENQDLTKQGSTRGAMVTNQVILEQANWSTQPQANPQAVKTISGEGIQAETGKLMDNLKSGDAAKTQSTISNLKTMLNSLEQELAN